MLAIHFTTRGGVTRTCYHENGQTFSSILMIAIDQPLFFFIFFLLLFFSFLSFLSFYFFYYYYYLFFLFFIFFSVSFFFFYYLYYFLSFHTCIDSFGNIW